MWDFCLWQNNLSISLKLASGCVDISSSIIRCHDVKVPISQTKTLWSVCKEKGIYSGQNTDAKLMWKMSNGNHLHSTVTTIWSGNSSILSLVSLPCPEPQYTLRFLPVSKATKAYKCRNILYKDYNTNPCTWWLIFRTANSVLLLAVQTPASYFTWLLVLFVCLSLRHCGPTNFFIGLNLKGA